MGRPRQLRIPPDFRPTQQALRSEKMGHRKPAQTACGVPQESAAARHGARDVCHLGRTLPDIRPADEDANRQPGASITIGKAKYQVTAQTTLPCQPTR